MRTLAALLFITTAAFAQPDCSVSGVVMNSVTGELVPRATVSMGRAAIAVTDSTGHWSAEHVGCGSINLFASRQTFIPGAPVQTVLVPDAPVRNLSLRLTPQAAVTGRVTDDYGDPIPNAKVSAKVQIVSNGLRKLKAHSAVTLNDIGEYRIAGLSPGRYMFCADAGGKLAYAGQCAGPMTIGGGYAGTVDFHLHSAPPHHVRGVVSGIPEGGGVQLTLSSESGSISGAVGEDGVFDIDGIAADSYTLVATAFSGDDRFIAILPVLVGNGDTNDVRAQLERPFSVNVTVHTVPAGRKIIFYASLQPDSQTLGGPSIALWNETRTGFSFRNVVAGSYRIMIMPPPPLHVERVAIAGRDVTGETITLTPGTRDIEVVLSEAGGILEGETEPGSAIALQRGAQTRGAVADEKGHFRIEGLPAGAYSASAWDDAAKVEYGDLAWMQAHASAVAVTISEGQTTQVKLTRRTVSDE